MNECVANHFIPFSSLAFGEVHVLINSAVTAPLARQTVETHRGHVEAQVMLLVELMGIGEE